MTRFFARFTPPPWKMTSYATPFPEAFEAETGAGSRAFSTPLPTIILAPTPLQKPVSDPDPGILTGCDPDPRYLENKIKLN